MAVETSELSILVKIKDQASAALKEITGNLKGAEESFEKVGVMGTAMFGSVAAVAYSSVKAFSEAETSQKMLEHAVIDVTHATQDQLKATMDLADSLEKKGILDGDNIKTGLAQLSTFGLSNEAVRKLGGSLADLAVNQYGVNASGEQLADTANTIAKALNGQFGVLEKSGIRFTDLQKQTIATGTEMEKVSAIIEGFNQNLKFTNDVAITTTEGQMAKLKVQVGNLSEAIGSALTPALSNFMVAITPTIEMLTSWSLEHPKLTVGILGSVAALGGLMLLIAAIGLGIPAVISGVTAIGTAVSVLGTTFLTFVGGPLALIAAGIVGIGVAAALLIKNWDQVSAKTIEIWASINKFFKQIWEGIKITFEFAISLITGIVVTAFNKMGIDIVSVWNNSWIAIKNSLAASWELIKSIVQTSFTWITEVFKTATEPLSKLWDVMWDSLGLKVSTVWDGIKNTIVASINWIIEKVNSLIRSINSAASAGGSVIGFKAPQIPSIPKLAEGGIVTRPTLALIGEAGPEAVIPLSGRNKGSAGGNNITINISGNSFLDNRAAEKMGEILVKKLGMQMKLS